MAEALRLQERLAGRARRALSERPADEYELFSVSFALPEVRPRTLPALHPPFFYWNYPDDGELILGLGSVRRIEATGQGRFQTLGSQWRELRWHHVDVDGTGLEPVSLFGCAFDPDDGMEGPWHDFPNAGLITPVLLWRQQAGATALTLTADAARDDEAILAEWDASIGEFLEAVGRPTRPAGSRTRLNPICGSPEPGAWLHLVEQAVRDIRAGRLQKVVPARRVRVCGERRLEPARLALTLDHLYPSCTTIAVQTGERCLIGATPERLVNITDGRLSSEAVAGTTRRAANERHDRELGAALLDSSKSLHEHRLVADALHDALAPLCRRLDMPASPELVKLRNLQHLRTPVEGELSNGTTLLEVAARLHPTPAVGGSPTDTAADWLKTHNPTARGWYTGSTGWMTPRGEGKLAVVLRCALLHDECADLFAGAGIVADSDPEAELAETELKLAAILEALENA